MDPLGLALLVAGAAALVVGILRARGPLATIRHLDATEANLKRYEDWRGKRAAVEAEGPTGADVMRARMRQRVILWGGIAVAGAVAAFVGLVLI